MAAIEGDEECRPSPFPERIGARPQPKPPESDKHPLVRSAAGLRILMDGRPAYGTPRGVGSYIIQLVSALGRISPETEVTVVMFGARATVSKVPIIPSPSAHCRLIRIPNALCSRLMSRPSLNRWVRSSSWGFDLAHDTGFEHFPFGRRVVLTLHDVHQLRLPYYQNHPHNAPFARRLRLAASRAKVTITDSEATRRDAIELLGLDPARTRTVLLGAPPMSAPRSEAQRAIDQGRLAALGVRGPYILSLGDVIPRKNNVSVVRALAELPASVRKNVQLVVAGHFGIPSVVDELRAEAERLGVAERMVLTGFVAFETRDALLANASALVFPSHYEGFGLPILEAMAKSVPVVASNNSSIPEVAGDAALLVDAYSDPGAWAVAIERALTDEAWRAEARVRGAARVETLSWEKTARETLENYRLAMAM